MPAPFSSSEQPSACPPYKEATLLLGLSALLLELGALLLGLGVLVLVLLLLLLLLLQISLVPAALPLAMLFTSTSKASNPGWTVSSHWEIAPLLSAPLLERLLLEEVVLLLLLRIGVPVPWGEVTCLVGVMGMGVGFAGSMAVVEGSLSLPLDLDDLRLLRKKNSRCIIMSVLKKQPTYTVSVGGA